MAPKLSDAVFELSLLVFIFVDRNSVVDSETCYGLDGPGIESHPDRPCVLQSSYTKGIRSFSRVQQHGRVDNHPTKLNPETEKKNRNYTSPITMCLHGELSDTSLIIGDQSDNNSVFVL